MRVRAKKRISIIVYEPNGRVVIYIQIVYSYYIILLLYICLHTILFVYIRDMIVSRIWTYTHIYTHTHTHIHSLSLCFVHTLCISVYMYICIYMCIHVYIYIYKVKQYIIFNYPVCKAIMQYLSIWKLYTIIPISVRAIVIAKLNEILDPPFSIINTFIYLIA